MWGNRLFVCNLNGVPVRYSGIWKNDGMLIHATQTHTHTTMCEEINTFKTLAACNGFTTAYGWCTPDKPNMQLENC